VSKIYIYREFGYQEIKEAGVVRQEVPIPEIAKGDGSQIPENIVTIHKEDTWQRLRFRGNPRKEHFSILATRNAKGKSSGLLTHEILKGSEPSDQGRLTAVDLPQEWSFDILEFGTSVFRIPK
jgi:hypothetical protein